MYAIIRKGSLILREMRRHTLGFESYKTVCMVEAALKVEFGSVPHRSKEGPIRSLFKEIKGEEK